MILSMMKNLLCMLIAAISLTGAVRAEEIGFYTFDAQVTAEVVDTNYVLHPMVFARPSLSGGEIAVTSIASQDGKEVPALVTKALRQAKNKVSVTFSHEGPVEEILKAHRRVAGVGVHGPFTVTGKLFLVIAPKGEELRLSGSVTPSSFSGPKGSWNR